MEFSLNSPHFVKFFPFRVLKTLLRSLFLPSLRKETLPRPIKNLHVLHMPSALSIQHLPQSQLMNFLKFQAQLAAQLLTETYVRLLARPLVLHPMLLLEDGAEHNERQQLRLDRSKPLLTPSLARVSP